MKVRVKEGQKFYDNVALRSAGDVCVIPDQPTRAALTAAERAIATDGRVPAAFSERSMEAVADGAPISTRGPRVVQADEPGARGTGSRDVI